jgi:hypothetical protein
MPKGDNKKHRGEIMFEEFLDDVEPILQRVGPVKIGDVWGELQDKYRCRYQYVYIHFTRVMSIMIEQRKARRLQTNGQYEILKPNIKRKCVDSTL